MLKGFNNYCNVFIFFTIFLIISITPASAGLVGDYGNDTDQNGVRAVDDKDRFTGIENSIENETNKIDGYMTGLNGDISYIKKRSGDFTWKVWKWPNIINDIICSMGNVLITAEKIQKLANDLKVSAQKLEASKNSSSDYVVTDQDLFGDANQMAVALTEKLDTKVTAKTVSNNEIKEGDIVQYLSQDQYPRYLIVKNITPDNTVKQNKSRGNIDDLIFLTGIGNIIFSTNMDQYIKLDYNTLNSSTVLNEIVDIQKNSIDQKLSKIKSLKDKEIKYTQYGKNLLYCAMALSALAVIVIVSGACSLVTLPVAIPITAVLGTSALFLLIAGGILLGLADYYNGEVSTSTKMYDYANNDLNQYTKNVNTTSMNISTFNGVPIVKKPDLSDWKEYQFILIKKAEHGDVLPGPGIQFLYGPQEGYTGTDTFTFEYSKNGEIKGIITVNIKIDPIPTISIPTGGKN